MKGGSGSFVGVLPQTTQLWPGILCLFFASTAYSRTSRTVRMSENCSVRYVKVVLLSLHIYCSLDMFGIIINPRHTCAARVTVLVGLSVCLQLFSHYRLQGGLARASPWGAAAYTWADNSRMRTRPVMTRILLSCAKTKDDDAPRSSPWPQCAGLYVSATNGFSTTQAWKLKWWFSWLCSRDMPLKQAKKANIPLLHCYLNLICLCCVPWREKKSQQSAFIDWRMLV